MRLIGIISIVSLGLVSATISASSQSQPFVPERMAEHIAVLASDSLEGREVGTIGEWKAAQYIVSVFKNAGLTPAGSDGFLQPFEFTKRIDFGKNCRLTMNGTALELESEFVPLQYSASATFDFSEIVPVDYGIRTEDSAYNEYAGIDVAGKAVLIKRSAPPAERNPHVDFSRYNTFPDKIRIAVERKAAGIIFVTPSNEDDTLMSFGVLPVMARDIPIVFVKRRALMRLGIALDSPTIESASGEVQLIRVKDTGYNVLGLIPGANDTTMILGAHYDHLGWGGTGSRNSGSEQAIHAGADDNGSGTAALLELARSFALNPPKHSILMAAFSGEEAGILGSSFYVRHWTVDSSKIRLMLNMDMIGRLKDQQNGLAVFGTGTATEFKPYFDSFKVDGIRLSFLEPGTGPSDHTAFYNSGIPVLHFFTGAHADYHKPSDTPDKIDYDGLARVTDLVARVVDHFDSVSGPLTFQRTKGTDEGKRRAEYKVTLGIMPDYTTPAKGVAIGGMTPNRPGEKAGIQKGDIVIRLGSFSIEDIYSYMSALGKFNKGDSATVVIVRASDTLSLPVQF